MERSANNNATLTHDEVKNSQNFDICMRPISFENLELRMWLDSIDINQAIGLSERSTFHGERYILKFELKDL